MNPTIRTASEGRTIAVGGDVYIMANRDGMNPSSSSSLSSRETALARSCRRDEMVQTSSVAESQPPRITRNGSRSSPSSHALPSAGAP